jgi:hypothetical protein
MLGKQIENDYPFSFFFFVGLFEGHAYKEQVNAARPATTKLPRSNKKRGGTPFAQK